MADVDDTALPTSSSTQAEPPTADDAENGLTVEQAAPVPPTLQSNVITDAIDNIGDLLDGDTTTADGTVIPREVIVTTASIIFGDFAAAYIAYTVIVHIVMFGEFFLDYDPGDVRQSNLILTGIDAVFFLVTGCFTDWYKGYYPAMHIYGITAFVGSCILPLLTFNWSVFGPSVVIPISVRRACFYVARIIISFGVSGIKVTAPPFAARQIERYGVRTVQSCFHYFEYVVAEKIHYLSIYTVVQFAPLIALTFLAFVQRNVSFFVGYLSTAVVNILTILFFKYARDRFRQGTPDNGKAATSLIVKTAAQAVKHKVTTSLSTVSSSSNCNCCPNLCSSVETVEEESMELLSDSALTSTTTNANVGDVADKKMATSSTSVDPSGSASANKFATDDPASNTATYGTLELLIADSTGALPETVRHALWICYAVLLLSTEFPYSIMRYQISSSYISQAERMKPTILGQVVSSSLLQRYLPLFGIALAPLVDVYIYPYISKRFTEMTMTTRIIIGIVFATLSVLSAAIVETARLTFIERGDYFVQEINNQTVVVSELTLDSLIPQYIFMGVADVLIFITGLEFAFRESPCTVQAVVTGIFFFYASLGRIVATLLVPLINTMTAADPWYPHEINDGHLNYYFLVLTAISLTNLIVFMLMEKGYEVMDVYLCPDAETYGGSTTIVTTTTTTAVMTSVTTPAPTTPPQPIPTTASSA